MGLVFLGDSAGYELMISLAFVAIFNVMMTSLQGVLQGSGRFYKPLKNLAIGIAVKFLLNVILISRPAIGIYGATYSSVIASAVIAVLNYRAVKKYIGVDPIAKPVFKTIIASVVMGVFAKFCFELLHTVLSSHIAVILTIILAAGIYFAIIVLTKAITKKELRSVRG
jgi:stage V sporulation protein B